MNRPIAVVCVFCCLSAAAWAQVTAQIHGTVRDASGAAVPGAEVKATNTDTGVSRTFASEADGAYVFTNLATGRYQVEVTKEGFATAVQSGIVLQVNADPLVDVALKVGAVSEQVSVQANATQVETRNATVGTVIDNQRIVELPLNGRDVTSLITLSGGAVSMGTARVGMGGSGMNIPPLLQIAGGLGYATSYTLDGATHLNYNSGSAIVMPFPDALQEFKVDTSGASSDQGRSSGVAAVTKSGTNTYHGDLFEFMRNDGVNANAYNVTGTGATKSTLKRNQFGGTIGGPIKKDRLFFFAAYQETKQTQNTANLETWVPTTKMLTGDFRDYASAACGQVRGGNLRAPYVGNVLPTALISPTALAFWNKYRARIPANLSPDLDPCGHVTYGQPDKQTELQGVGRMDYQLSERHTLFARYQNVMTYEPTGADLSPDNILNQQATGRDDYTQSLALGSTYVLSPTMVNAFRIASTFSRVRTTGTETFSLCDAQRDAGLPVTWAGSCVFTPHANTLLISGGPTFNGGIPINPFNLFIFSINDDFSLIRGAHQMTMGFVGAASKNSANFKGITPGRITINGGATGTGLSDLMAGQVSQLVQSAVNRMDIASINPSLYFADTWKARSRLTVNMSVRWDPYIPQRLKRGGVANFDLSRFAAGTRTSKYPYAPSGWYYPGDPGYPGSPESSSGINTRWKYLAPRLGLAWDVTGDGKTSVRSSFSYTYSPVLNYWRQDGFDNSPWDMGIRRAGIPLDDPWGSYQWVDIDHNGATRSGSPYPILDNRGFVSDGDQISTDININEPRTSAWNVSIQRQLGSDWVMSAAYMGANTTHIWIQDQLNPAVITGTPRATNCGSLSVAQCSGPDNVPDRRLFNQLRPLASVATAGPGNEIIRMGTVSRQYSGATMSYEGLLLSAQKRLSRGTTLQANYTWSHCIGDAADIISSGPDAGESHTIPGNRTFDRGDCNGDRRHLFNLTAVGRTPKFSGRALRLLASDWQLAGIYRYASGQPLALLAGSDRALNGQLGFFAGTAYQRADEILPFDQAITPGAGGPLSQYINKAAFAVPALGTVGNSRRNQIKYAPLWNFDIALSRAFPITESQRIELRGEAFNVLNSFVPGNPGPAFTAVSSGIFGQIRNAQDARILQFALKYVF